MKIIKQGVVKPPPPPFWVGQIITCGRCDTVFALEEGDKINWWQDRGMLNGNIHVLVDCPQCGHSIDHKIVNKRKDGL